MISRVSVGVRFWQPLQRHERAALAQHRRRAGGDVEVRRLLLDDLDEDLGEVEVHGPSRASAGRARDL